MLGLEMNLNLLEEDLDVVDKNLIYLSRMRDDLIYNINLHRSGEVVTVIKEYRRSIDELEIVKEEIIKYENHRKMLKSKMEKKMKAYDFYLDEYKKAYNELNSEPVLLLFRKERNEQEEA